VIKKRKKNHLVASVSAMVVLLLGSSSVAAWSLFNSDASKYRNECRKACVEDGFGRAQAPEIQMRCSAKCDDLPLSPRDQWDAFDACESEKERHKAFYAQNSSLLKMCEVELDTRERQCQRTALSSTAGSGPRPSGREDPAFEFHRKAIEAGQNAVRHTPQYKDFVKDQCRDKAHKERSSECVSLGLEKIRVDFFQERRGGCSPPTVARPR
jgi:hypothetical protein